MLTAPPADSGGPRWLGLEKRRRPNDYVARPMSSASFWRGMQKRAVLRRFGQTKTDRRSPAGAEIRMGNTCSTLPKGRSCLDYGGKKGDVALTFGRGRHF